MVKVTVEPGVCGHQTRIKVLAKDHLNVKVELESECEHIDNMGRELNDVDAYRECFTSRDNSLIHQIASKHCQHSGCPVPMAIIKGIEVAVGKEKAEDVHVHLEKDG